MALSRPNLPSPSADLDASVYHPRGGVPGENSENLANSPSSAELTLNVTEAPEITDYKSGQAIAPLGNQCGKLVGAGRSRCSYTGGCSDDI